MLNPNWQRILTATDLSPFAETAVKYAHGLAEKFGAELHVMHVVEDSTEAARLMGTTGTYDPAEKDNPATAWLGNLLGESGSIRRTEVVQIGKDVAAKIVRYAGTQGIDVIVMATHGRTGLAHVWLGSVTEEVCRTAPCPVLLLRPRAEDLPERRAQ
jgi:nucleotide-binding universal stress UspA family protein